MSLTAIPENWVKEQAGNVFEQVSTSTKKVKTKDCKDKGKYPVIDQGQLSIAGYINDDDKVIQVVSPLIIFGDHTRVIKWVESDFAPGADGTKVLEPRDFLEPRFFYYQLRAIELPDKGYARHFKYLKESVFFIPSLAEQKQISAKLDELLVQVDTIKTRLDAIPTILKRFRQSVLAAAVSGRLTEKWRNDNCPKQVWKSGFDAKLIEQHAEPFDLPKTWVWDHLGNLVNVHNSLRVPLKQADRDKRSGPYPYYGAFGIIDDIDDYLFDGEYILLAEDGKNLESRVRPIALVAEGKFWVNNHAHVLEAKDGIFNSYINHFLNSTVVLIDQFLTGQDQVKLNRKAMVLIPVPVPSINEQFEIIRRIEQLFTFADQIEQRVKDAQSRVNHLTQSILAKAFRGELTTEWRERNHELISGDNSAVALLNRIKEERQSAPLKTQNRKKRA